LRHRDRRPPSPAPRLGTRCAVISLGTSPRLHAGITCSRGRHHSLVPPPPSPDRDRLLRCHVAPMDVRGRRRAHPGRRPADGPSINPFRAGPKGRLRPSTGMTTTETPPRSTDGGDHRATSPPPRQVCRCVPRGPGRGERRAGLGDGGVPSEPACRSGFNTVPNPTTARAWAGTAGPGSSCLSLLFATSVR
jgi:hypothetical protein